MTDPVRPQVAPLTTCRTSGTGPCEFQLEGGAFCDGGRCMKYGEQVEDTVLGTGEAEKLATIDGKTIDLRAPWGGWGGNGPGRDGGPGGGRG